MDVEEKEETLIRNAYVYLTKKNYPEGCTSDEKRVINKYIHDIILCYVP